MQNFRFTVVEKANEKKPIVVKAPNGIEDYLHVVILLLVLMAAVTIQIYKLRKGVKGEKTEEPKKEEASEKPAEETSSEESSEENGSSDSSSE